MAYTALPGYYGVDEEESEMTLGFWYLFQEALWSTDPDYDSEELPTKKHDVEQWAIAKAVYSELIKVLQRKATWPERSILQSWPRGNVVLVKLKHQPLTIVQTKGTSSKRERNYDYISPNAHVISDTGAMLEIPCLTRE